MRPVNEPPEVFRRTLARRGVVHRNYRPAHGRWTRQSSSVSGAQVVDGFQTYHVMNPFDDGIGLDEYVDWLIDKDIPHVTAPIIVKYITNLQLLGLL